MTFPASSFDDPDLVLALIGSFWSETYTERAYALRGVKARCDLLNGIYVRLGEAADVLARLRCPVFRRENWHHLVLSESARGARPARYGVTATPYQGGGLLYDGGEGGFVYPLPAGAADVRVMFNRVTAPSASLFRGIDFWIEDGFVRFATDPFADDRFAVAAVTEDGVDTDRELSLWMYNADFDDDYVYAHWGFVAGVKARSSEGYKSLVNALLDSTVLGTSVGRLEAACCHAAGVPVAVGGDTVLAVTDDYLHTLVITDRAAYRLPLGSTPTRAVGETFYAGEPVSDAVRVFEFNRAQGPDDLPGLSLGRGFLLGAFMGELGFPNETTTLVAEDMPDASVRVSCALGGHPADVEHFWNLTHELGLASGLTLADRIGYPLPATINPLAFLLEHVLRNNAFVVRVKMAGLGVDGAGLAHVGAVARLVPPHTGVVFVIEADPVSQTTEQPSDEDLPDGLDGGDTFVGESGLLDTVSVIVGRVASGQCQ